MEKYFAAKARLFEGVGAPPSRVAVINADDQYGNRALALIAQYSGDAMMGYGSVTADTVRRCTDSVQDIRGFD